MKQYLILLILALIVKNSLSQRVFTFQIPFSEYSSFKSIASNTTIGLFIPAYYSVGLADIGIVNRGKYSFSVQYGVSNYSLPQKSYFAGLNNRGIQIIDKTWPLTRNLKYTYSNFDIYEDELNLKRPTFSIKMMKLFSVKKFDFGIGIIGNMCKSTTKIQNIGLLSTEKKLYIQSIASSFTAISGGVPININWYMSKRLMLQTNLNWQLVFIKNSVVSDQQVSGLKDDYTKFKTDEGRTVQQFAGVGISLLYYTEVESVGKAATSFYKNLRYRAIGY